MNEHSLSNGLGWSPVQGSWEESVLSWHEQVDAAFRHKVRTAPVASRLAVREGDVRERSREAEPTLAAA